jgi:hypothetical protein
LGIKKTTKNKNTMYRHTYTQKWADNWFGELSKEGKLLFMYLSDNCDNAGFYEVSLRNICYFTGITKEEAISAFEEIKKGFIYLNEEKTHIWLKNFLLHQRKFPLNLKNNEHKSIVSIFKKHIERFGEKAEYNKVLPTQEKQEKPKKDRKKREPKSFIKPTQQELEDYWIEIGGDKYGNADLFATTFLNHYDSNGWKIGAAKMADWKATAMKWLIRRKEDKSTQASKSQTRLEALEEANKKMHIDYENL